MKETQRNKWERTRVKGKKNYIFYNGIIGWGIPTAILFTFISSYLENSSIILNQAFFKSLLSSIVIFSIGGIFFGLWTWHWTERIYKNSISKE